MTPQSEAESQGGFTARGHSVHSWQTDWRTDTAHMHNNSLHVLHTMQPAKFAFSVYAMRIFQRNGGFKMRTEDSRPQVNNDNQVSALGGRAPVDHISTYVILQTAASRHYHDSMCFNVNWRHIHVGYRDCTRQLRVTTSVRGMDYKFRWSADPVSQ